MEFGDAMEAGWDDEESAAVLRTVGRIIKKFRERAGLTQAELGAAIGYSEEQVSSVERGRRAPSAQFLGEADRVLGAGGLILELLKDVEEARFPKKVRDVKKLEAEAIEMGSYETSVIDGLLQTPDYARALYEARRPPLPEDELERQVAARLARQQIIEGSTAKPVCNFVQDEATLRRPIGGRMVMRDQLERLLEVGHARHIDIQVLPLGCEDNAGLAGSFRLLRLKNGKTVGLNEVQLISRVISDPREVQILEMRYGIIRAQALTPRRSRDFIKKVLEET
ncbi:MULTISPECIES: helix-turn-helix transcriptional regulator [unclassified Streptomyces]|uniref:helix-turn-helix domain-containing protein n=1 Tax=unclassified Streptomyces TaxID=2593676 RepID=UPI000370708E|nr:MULTISPECIES: helix-turn-helix transcriptional regulator [unclassified Streptomyces]MYX25630.1 helix-turn-helix domain-containing protein [Streptomyces sp. SID8381]